MNDTVGGGNRFNEFFDDETFGTEIMDDADEGVKDVTDEEAEDAADWGVEEPANDCLGGIPMNRFMALVRAQIDLLRADGQKPTPEQLAYAIKSHAVCQSRRGNATEEYIASAGIVVNKRVLADFLQGRKDKEDPSKPSRKRARVLADLPQRNPRANPLEGKNLLDAVCEYGELSVELGKHLEPRDILNLFRTCRPFHDAIRGSFRSSIVVWARTRVPLSFRIFRPEWYEKYLITDLSKQPPSAPPLHPLLAAVTHVPPAPARQVPGLGWLNMVVNRDRKSREILAILARSGYRTPKNMKETLLKLWMLLDISTNSGRLELIRDSVCWTDQDIYNAQLFFIKLDLHFNDPHCGYVVQSITKLFLGQRGLELLWQALFRKSLTSARDVVELKVLYDFEMRASHITARDNGHLSVFGVPFKKVGSLHLEGWGRGLHHLKRPDELVMEENCRRGLRLDRHFRAMCIWGNVDWDTAENTVPTEEEMWISDEEDKLEAVDRAGHWKPRHARKKQWARLSEDQKDQIIEEESREMLRAEAWGKDGDDDFENHHSYVYFADDEPPDPEQYDPNEEMERGWATAAIPKPAPETDLDDPETLARMTEEEVADQMRKDTERRVVGIMPALLAMPEVTEEDLLRAAMIRGGSTTHTEVAIDDYEFGFPQAAGEDGVGNRQDLESYARTLRRLHARLIAQLNAKLIAQGHREHIAKTNALVNPQSLPETCAQVDWLRHALATTPNDPLRIVQRFEKGFEQANVQANAQANDQANEQANVLADTLVIAQTDAQNNQAANLENAYGKYSHLDEFGHGVDPRDEDGHGQGSSDGSWDEDQNPSSGMASTDTGSGQYEESETEFDGFSGMVAAESTGVGEEVPGYDGGYGGSENEDEFGPSGMAAADSMDVDGSGPRGTGGRSQGPANEQLHPYSGPIFPTDETIGGSVQAAPWGQPSMPQSATQAGPPPLDSLGRVQFWSNRLDMLYRQAGGLFPPDGRVQSGLFGHVPQQQATAPAQSQPVHPPQNGAPAQSGGATARDPQSYLLPSNYYIVDDLNLLINPNGSQQPTTPAASSNHPGTGQRPFASPHYSLGPPAFPENFSNPPSGGRQPYKTYPLGPLALSGLFPSPPSRGQQPNMTPPCGQMQSLSNVAAASPFSMTRTSCHPGGEDQQSATPTMPPRPRGEPSQENNFRHRRPLRDPDALLATPAQPSGTTNHVFGGEASQACGLRHRRPLRDPPLPSPPRILPLDPKSLFGGVSQARGQQGEGGSSNLVDDMDTEED